MSETNNSYKIYASKDYVDEKVPSTSDPYMQLVTDGEGTAGWEQRLAWKAEEKVTIIPEQTFAYASSGVDLENYDSAELTTACVVVFDGVVYHCEPSTLTTMTMKMYRFGNLNKIAGSWTDSGEPFALEFGEYLAGYGEGWMAPKVYTGDSVEHTIFVYTLSETTHPIPAEYITGAPLTDTDNGKVVGVVDGAVSLVELQTETWTFTLEDGTTVTKNVVVK